MHLDEALDFNHHIDEKIAQANKGIELIRKLALVLPRQSLITIYKSFIRPHLVVKRFSQSLREIVLHSFKNWLELFSAFLARTCPRCQ